MDFIDELPPSQSGRYGMFRAKLREQPGRWAPYPYDFASAGNARVAVYHVTHRPAWDGFEAAWRNGSVYVRYVGEETMK